MGDNAVWRGTVNVMVLSTASRCTLRRLAAAASMTTLVLLAACSGSGGDTSPSSSLPSTTLADPDVPQMATPPPEDPPQRVEASGECAEAFGAARAVMDEVPSGLALDPADAETLNVAVSDAAAVCDDETLQAFMNVEYKPWLNYEVPGADMSDIELVDPTD